MPNFPRTDLAVEAEAIHRSAAAVTELPGVPRRPSAAALP